MMLVGSFGARIHHAAKRHFAYRYSGQFTGSPTEPTLKSDIPQSHSHVFLQERMHKTNQSNVKMPSAPLYSPLLHRRDIRLLCIKSGASREDVEVTLETFKLDSDTQFTALSYVWGDVIASHRIVCNGHKTPITRNLWVILSQLRKQQFDRLLWVDAICINQTDKSEKSLQVAMMRDIYKRAVNVIFWLGEQERYDEDAVHLMRIFFKKYPNFWDLERHRVKTLEELGFSSDNDGWSGWASLLSRPWFGRIWIVQEFLNAKNSVFMSGALEISTELLVHCGYATRVCAAIGEVVVRHSRDARDTRRLILRPLALSIFQSSLKIAGADGIRIFDLWCNSQQLEATDPRDRVFALLSTQTAVGMDMIDYSKDEATVYKEIATKALNIPVPAIKWTRDTFQAPKSQPQSGGLHRVSRFLACKFCSPQSSSLPSWVPDWKPVGFAFVPLTRYYTGTASFRLPYHHAIVEDKVRFHFCLFQVVSDRSDVIYIRDYHRRALCHDKLHAIYGIELANSFPR